MHDYKSLRAAVMIYTITLVNTQTHTQTQASGNYTGCTIGSAS